ncbi:uncharacterized protein LOC117255335 [Epinephelus lanceolatus]
MIQHAVIYLLCALGHFQKGLAAVIETQQTVMAAVGEEALLNCQLMQPKDVVRMKWQKVLPKGVENLAFSTKDSAGQVNPDFRDKVEFKDAGLQNSSIVIKNVMEEDEGCYRCVLYTDTDGALNATTCLQLYGLAAVIETQQTVMAVVGEEALLNCQLMQPKDVLQVTWQKILPDKKQNVATYTEYFGEKVNRDFRDKVEFKYAGLQNSSIVIRRVTEEDEGCYHCLFNTYPDGALTGSTCLQLYELHEPVLHVRESNSPEEAVVSCSATGRPAPTVRLTVPHYNSTSVTNTNATVTVTATAVLPRLHGNSTQVGCAVRVLSGPQIEVFTMIPEVTLSSADDVTLITVLVVVSCVCVAAAVIIIILLIRKHQNRLSHRDSEENKTRRRTTKDTEEDGTLVVMQDSEQVRQRTPPEKNRTSDQPTPPSPARRKLNFVF